MRLGFRFRVQSFGFSLGFWVRGLAGIGLGVRGVGLRVKLSRKLPVCFETSFTGLLSSACIGFVEGFT